jgi:eukaryotic translation initiation factor 2C
MANFMIVGISQEGSAQPPDMSIARIENDTESKLNQTMTKSKTLTPSFPQRPGFGVAGKPILLWTNYFKLDSTDDLVLHRYAIEIRPLGSDRMPTGKKAKRVVELFMEEHMLPHGNDVVTDFKSNLISRNELDVKEDGYPIFYKAEVEDDPPANAKIYTIHLQSTGTFTASELIQYLSSSQAGLTFGSKEEIIQLLNIVVGYNPKASSSIASVGANRHFDRDPSDQDKMSLGAGLQAIRGLFLSVRAATARILVNVQVKPMAFYEEGPLDRVMQAYTHINGSNPVSLMKFLKKLSIDVTHIQRKNKAGQRVPRIKTIQGFASKDDGRNLAHPPKIRQYAAGPKHVEFYLDASPAAGSLASKAGPSASGSASAPPSGGKKKGKKATPVGPAPASAQGRHITVFDFFKQSKSFLKPANCD